LRCTEESWIRNRGTGGGNRHSIKPYEFYLSISFPRAFNDCKRVLRIKDAVRIKEERSQHALTFEAIAPQVGFASYSTFYKSFKNMMGITPMEMRNRLTWS
jgi:AraC-like DNA-binding protein